MAVDTCLVSEIELSVVNWLIRVQFQLLIAILLLPVVLMLHVLNLLHVEAWLTLSADHC